MAKAKTVYVCNACGHESGHWAGKCSACSAWNTLEEQAIEAATKAAGRGRASVFEKEEPAILLDEVEWKEGERIPSGYVELDRVLGGGIVPASLVLAGGDPGIGKSTLLLQVAGAVGVLGKRVLYISAEESAAQIRMRAVRLNVRSKNIYILAKTRIESILSQIEQLMPDIVVIDSIQTVYSAQLSAAPGTVSQVRECAMQLFRTAKAGGASIFLVGHVTKEGTLAGPRVLEHMVDTVLYFEGERHNAYRILRAAKNRFGSTNEIGVFEMAEAGMVEVSNPSDVFLSETRDSVTGSVVTCTLEGTRPVLAEIQALVSPTAFGNPRRMATGFDYNRAVLLMAVLEKKVGIPLYNQDVYLNVVGGLRVVEPAADLAVICAIASNFKNIPIDKRVVAVGEVGLTGEVRSVFNMDKRMAECHKLGFDTLIAPKSAIAKLAIPDGLNVVGVSSVRQALTKLFPAKG